MKAHHLSLFFILLSLSSASKTTARETSTVIQDSIVLRRILHQPLFPAGSAPAPGTEISSTPPTPPSPDSPVFPDPSQPFFPEVPSGGQTPDQNQQTGPPPAAVLSSNASIPIPTATQPAKPAKKVAIAISVGIVTFGMLSGLAFLLYRHRAKKHHGETQKLVGRNSSEQFQENSRVPPSSFLYIGTVEPSRRSVTEVNGGANISPYHKLNSVKKSDRYRPSPELQPLPPLAKPLTLENSTSAVISSSSSSSDAESRGTAFYTPQGSVINNEESVYASVSRSVNGNLVTPARNEMNGNFNSVPRSKRTSPKTMILASSPEMKHIIPSIKQQQPPSPPAPPSPLSLSHQQPPGRVAEPRETQEFAIAKRPKFSSPPPPPNMALLRSISSNSSPQITKVPVPPAPPPPPSLPPKAAVGLSIQRTVRSLEANVSPNPAKLSRKREPGTPSPKNNPGSRTGKSMEDVNYKGSSSSEKTDGDDMDSTKPKLKPLHWDKVRATSERATVWDQLKSSSFQLNEDMMETLFGCNSTNSLPREPIRRSVLPPVDQENRVLDPKKSQNIAILLRALNVTRDEVSEALLDGNPESLGAELLETLVKMAPTKEEEIKLREYNGDISKLGSAERFLKTVLDIPFAFRRVEAMLYRANFDTEIKYLRKSFQTLEEASEELKNSRLFLKLLEAVLRTGNRMNVGTNRGDAKAFKLDTLLKLVDIKGTDGKTTLLHFVVQEIIRSEGAAGANSTNGNPGNKTSSNVKDEDFRKQGLQVVAGLSRDLSNVKKAAGMDSDVLSSYVSKLETGLDKVRSVLQYEKPDMQGNFFNSMRVFQRDAEEEIAKIKEDERKALLVVKEVTEYFHGNAAKEGAHPFRIFMIVRDFLSILDHVCKEVGHMQDRTMVGSARSFRISSTASLPVLSRYNVRQDGSSDDESLSP